MKKKLLVLSLFISSVTIFSQGLVYFDSNLQHIDSIHVTNLNTCEKITLKSDDTLQLGTLVSAQTYVEEITPFRLYPNPMTEESIIDFFSETEGNIVLQIYDISGKNLKTENFNAVKGVNLLHISGLKTGTYIVKVNTAQKSFSSQLVCLSRNKADLSVKILNSTSKDILKTKTTKSIVSMSYTPGDVVLFKGYSGAHSVIITKVITQNETLLFNFVQCEDIDNNNYTVLQIGSQTWMAENLKTTKYKTGTPITYPNTDNNAWTSNLSGAYAWYNNDINNKDIYGGLYNWHAVNTGNLCPTGWHVPSLAEWTTLVSALGGTLVAGGKLKTVCTSLWNTPNLASNSSGFSALPSGTRFSDAMFYDINTWAMFWTTNEYSSNQGVSQAIEGIYESLISVNLSKNNGYSVRCIKD